MNKFYSFCFCSNNLFPVIVVSGRSCKYDLLHISSVPAAAENLSPLPAYTSMVAASNLVITESKDNLDIVAIYRLKASHLKGILGNTSKEYCWEMKGLRHLVWKETLKPDLIVNKYKHQGYFDNQDYLQVKTREITFDEKEMRVRVMRSRNF